MAMTSPLELCDISSVCLTCILCGSQNSCYQIPEDSRDQMITALCCVCDFNLAKDKETFQWAFFCFDCLQELGRIQEMYERVQDLRRQLERFKEKSKCKLREFIKNSEDISQGYADQNIQVFQGEAELAGGGENTYDDEAEVELDYGNYESENNFEQDENNCGETSSKDCELEQDRNDSNSKAVNERIVNNKNAANQANSKTSPELEALYNTLKAKYNIKECYVKFCSKRKVIVKAAVNKLPVPIVPKIPCPFLGCGKEFKSEEKKHDHFILQHEGTPGIYNCKDCEETFKDRSRFRDHLNVHKNLKPYECPTCGEKFHSVEQLHTHKVHTHDPPKVICEDCGKGFRSQSSCKLHRLSHTAERLFQCECCDKSFKSVAALRYHTRSHPLLDVGLFKCKRCPKVLTTEKYLKMHEKWHDREFRFRCDICNFGTHYREKFDLHAITHSNVKEFECNVCHLQFKHKKYLKRHTQLRHLEPRETRKTHCCSECGKLFTTKHTLIKHMKVVHSTERSFCCSSCGKVFALSYYLISHMRSRHPEVTFTPSDARRKL